MLYSYAGVRPLPYEPFGSEGSISRRHVIYERDVRGIAMFAIVGGKLTTHRRLAEQVVDRVCRRLGHTTRCVTATTPLPNAADTDAVAARLKARGVTAPIAARLARVYGSGAHTILAPCAGDAWLSERLLGNPSVLRAEIAHALTHRLLPRLLMCSCAEQC